jgi:hypothetical protein
LAGGELRGKFENKLEVDDCGEEFQRVDMQAFFRFGDQRLLLVFVDVLHVDAPNNQVTVSDC